MLEEFRRRDYERCAAPLDAVRYCRYEFFEYSIKDRNACVLPLRGDCSCDTDAVDCSTHLPDSQLRAHAQSWHALQLTRPLANAARALQLTRPTARALYLPSPPRDLFTRTARERVLPNNDVIARAHC